MGLLSVVSGGECRFIGRSRLRVQGVEADESFCAVVRLPFAGGRRALTGWRIDLAPAIVGVGIAASCCTLKRLFIHQGIGLPSVDFGGECRFIGRSRLRVQGVEAGESFCAVVHWPLA